jgi:hypothetical protein
LIVGACLAMLNATALIESPLPVERRSELLRALTLTALRGTSDT